MLSHINQGMYVLSHINQGMHVLSHIKEGMHVCYVILTRECMC